MCSALLQSEYKSHSMDTSHLNKLCISVLWPNYKPLTVRCTTEIFAFKLNDIVSWYHITHYDVKTCNFMWGSFFYLYSVCEITRMFPCGPIFRSWIVKHCFFLKLSPIVSKLQCIFQIRLDGNSSRFPVTFPCIRTLRSMRFTSSSF